VWRISPGHGWTGGTVFKNAQTASGRFHDRTGDSGVAGHTRHGCSNPSGCLQRETGRGHGCEICADARRGPLTPKSIFARAHEQEFLETRGESSTIRRQAAKNSSFGIDLKPFSSRECMIFAPRVRTHGLAALADCGTPLVKV
jgi:hypothetical protein